MWLLMHCDYKIHCSPSPSFLSEETQLQLSTLDTSRSSGIGEGRPLGKSFKLIWYRPENPAHLTNTATQFISRCQSLVFSPTESVDFIVYDAKFLAQNKSCKRLETTLVNLEWSKSLGSSSPYVNLIFSLLSPFKFPFWRSSIIHVSQATERFRGCYVQFLMDAENNIEWTHTKLAIL